MAASVAPAFRKHSIISIPLPVEWRDQAGAIAAFKTERQKLASQLVAATVPDPKLAQAARASIAAPARRVALTAAEAAAAQTYIQSMQAAADAADSPAYCRALAAALLYCTLPEIGALHPESLQPWLAPLIAAAVTDHALLSVGDDTAASEAALNWCSGFIQAMQAAQQQNKLPGGQSAWQDQWLPLLGFDITAINFYSTAFSLRDFVGSIGALRAAAFKAHPAASDGSPVRIIGALPERTPQKDRCRLALFCSHPTAHGHGLPHIIWWLACLDRQKFEPVLIFRQLPENAVLIEKLLGAYAGLVDYAPILIVNDGNLEQLARFNFDLLYNFDDLCRGRSERPGYTRIAPKQVTAFYTPATTGAAAMDYFITSSALDPKNRDEFTEQVILSEGGLPFCFHYESYFGVTPLWAQRDADLPPDAVIYTMGSSMLTKLKPEFISALLEIMRQVPNSYCIAMPSSRPKERLHLAAYLMQQCAAKGIDPARIRLYQITSRPLLHGLLSIGDVFLDFFPFSGTNNLMDPIAVGTPCVTLCPEPGFSRNRIGGTILHQLSLGDLVTATVPDYIALAVRLGADPALRAAIRARMGRKMLENSDLCNGPNFVRRMEQAFAEILQGGAGRTEARYA